MYIPDKEIEFDLTNHDGRIEFLSPQRFNKRIEQRTKLTIAGAKALGPAVIKQRLNELEQEWELDRALMTVFSVVVFAQLLLSRKNPKWLRGPLLQTSFLFMHSTLGWCPPVLPLRALGFRTKHEIHKERESLLAYLKEIKSELTPRDT